MNVKRLLVRTGEEPPTPMRFECVSRTDVGLRRKINEDSVFVDSERGLWAVADGMGGHEAGEVASSMVADALRCLPVASDIDELAVRAVEALRQVNRDLVELARSGERKGQTIGTTVVGLAVANGLFRCFWLGDSRAYRCATANHAPDADHSLVQNSSTRDAEPEEADTMRMRPDYSGGRRGREYAVDIVGGEPGRRPISAGKRRLTRVSATMSWRRSWSATPTQAADKADRHGPRPRRPDNVR